MEKTKTTPAKRKKKVSVSAEVLPEGPISTVQVLLNVRLWIAEGAEVPPMALAMVGDLLSASPCEVRDRSSSSIAASFPDAAQAVMAARRLRRLFQGFSRSFKTGQLGGCFILSNSVEGLPGIEPQLLEHLPVMARGNHGEVFLVGDLCEAAKSIPGLRFEAVFGDWRPPGTDRLYRSVLKLMPPVQMESYVDEAPEDGPPAVSVTSQWVSSVSAPVSLAAEVPAIAQVSEGAARIVGDRVITAGAEVGGFSRVERAPRRGFPLGWVLGGTAAAMIAAAAILVPYSKRSQIPVQYVIPVAPVSPATVNTGGSLPPPAVSTPAPAQTEVPKSAVTIPKLSAKEIAATKRKAAVADRGQSTDEADAGAEATKKDGGDRTLIPLSPDEINRSLALADKESGDGRFDDAISTYRIILKHDPGNARAKEGLERAIRNKGSQ